MKEAVKYQVLPIDDRSLERLNAALVGRPDLMAGRTSLTVFEGMTGMTENVFINVKNRSHTITAEVEIPERGGEGVILCQAGRFGGWSLYLKEGKPAYTTTSWAWSGSPWPLRKPCRPARRPSGSRSPPTAASRGRGHGHDPRQRQEGRRRADRSNARVRLLRGRGGRRRRGRGDAGHGGLQGARQRIHGQDQQGDDRAEVSPRAPGSRSAPGTATE